MSFGLSPKFGSAEKVVSAQRKFSSIARQFIWTKSK